MTYGSASGVATYCNNLLGSEPTWGTDTNPTKKQVDSFLSTGCAVIETVLQSKGYNTPVASGTAARGWMERLEELWGAAHAEFHRTNITLGPGERTRGAYFYEMFWDEFDRILKMDLSIGGVGRSANGKIYVSGIHVSDKQAVESNSNLVKPRFFRGVGRIDGAYQEQPRTASQST